MTKTTDLTASDCSLLRMASSLYDEVGIETYFDNLVRDKLCARNKIGDTSYVRATDLGYSLQLINDLKRTKMSENVRAAFDNFVDCFEAEL